MPLSVACAASKAAAAAACHGQRDASRLNTCALHLFAAMASACALAFAPRPQEVDIVDGGVELLDGAADDVDGRLTTARRRARGGGRWRVCCLHFIHAHQQQQRDSNSVI